MKLVEQSDLQQAVKIKGLNSQPVSALLMNTLKINKVNEVYANNLGKSGVDFVDGVLKELGIHFQINEADLKRIPEKGPFITISNHPFGGIDGLILISLLGKLRPDFKIMGNFLLQRIEPIHENIVPVNPFETHKQVKSSTGGIKQAIKHLLNNGALGIFPAGEVSTFDERIIQDRQWSNSILKFIKKTQVPVIPIYFHGNNSALFHFLGMVNPLFRTAKLPSELFNKKKKSINIRIGSPISIETQDEFTDIAQYGRFLRSKTYALGSSLEVKKFYHNIPLRLGKPDKIIDPIPVDVMQAEIEAIKPNSFVFESGDFQVYCASATHIPYILNEIGRLREITFREVGEGTNKNIDLDEFDLYYQHLFIWDNLCKQIVGAYRLGKGQEIIKNYGKKGFYVQTLFSMKKELLPVLEKTIELGRSFVTKEYQKKPAPLFLLWKGILYVLLKNPEYRYLIGPVSISNSYSKLSKSLMIDFIKSNYFHHLYAPLVKPKKQFKVKYKKVDSNLMLDSTKGDLQKLDRIIEEIEPTHYKLPVLLKKYLKQNARILAFNVDPRFNNSLDGLMMLDLLEVPFNTIQSLSKELNDYTITERFYSKLLAEEYDVVPQL